MLKPFMTLVNPWLVRLASLRLTLAIFVLLGASITYAYFSDVRTSPGLVISLSLLAVNLLAVISTNPTFRRQGALLVFHLALLGIVILVAVGRLTYLKGKAEVVEGQDFEGVLLAADTGPWHPWGLEKARFTNLGFRIQYAPGVVRLGTENRVGWTDENGKSREEIIGDHRPLVRNHYRFYANWNKGFALLFGWEPHHSEPVMGSVNLPGYPANALKQAQQWQLPGEKEPVWAMLQFDGELIPADREGEFRLPENYQVVVRQGELRWVLDPKSGNDVLELPTGRLRFVGLSTWMGYDVTWDRTLPWLLGDAVLAVLALGWHFWRKFASRPWNS